MRNSVRPRKRYGQHFLHDPNIIRKIIDAIQPRSHDLFVEVGPGRGAITRPLAEAVKRLDVIEIDRDLAAALKDQNSHGNVTVYRADVMNFAFETLVQPGEKLRLAGNLPYNISSPLLFYLLDSSHLFEDIHVTLQKEVVDRITALPGNRTYGRLTVALAARCKAENLFEIQPGSFSPPPRVKSSFLRLTPLQTPKISAVLAPAFGQLVTQAFNMRRKQLSNALRGLLDANQIRSAGVDPSQRAENLDVDAFIRLAELWLQQGSLRGDEKSLSNRLK
ncbi:MAG: 16S rRNA (adenine(1518)-N(6)/adenine(1519)-N(6))-dimethyltransferase RsmA [Gammaproteobacteria bacterium]|nr:16S rRNA (adenine(1518)-N(6)/adenine(1519)-N(6))-dimethyltransferase RsmA [Gammaproteobacteria bacterium]